MHDDERVGILLVNLGTPQAPEAGPVRAYLKEFLSDPRVLDTSAPARWLVLRLFILPRRPAESAKAYRKIWTDEGSPLLIHSRGLTSALREKLPDVEIELAMRYGQPSIAAGLDALAAQPLDRIIVAPLYPQYSSAATGSSLERIYQLAAQRWNVPNISALPPFYADPGFLNAWKAVGAPVLEAFRPDHLLFSYHGLPERHMRKSDPSGQHCLASSACCDAIVPAHRNCYRAQCMATTRGLVERLGLENERYSSAFQSRLGRDPWIKPYTDHRFIELAQQGVKRLAVFSPAFVADCLETLEELDIRGRESFLEAGGEDFVLVPSLNTHPAWAEALADMLRRL